MDDIGQAGCLYSLSWLSQQPRMGLPCAAKICSFEDAANFSVNAMQLQISFVEGFSELTKQHESSANPAIPHAILSLMAKPVKH